MKKGDVLIHEQATWYPAMYLIKEVDDETLTLVRLQGTVEASSLKSCAEGYVFILPVLDWELGSPFQIMLSQSQDLKLWDGCHILCKAW